MFKNRLARAIDELKEIATILALLGSLVLAVTIANYTAEALGIPSFLIYGIVSILGLFATVGIVYAILWIHKVIKSYIVWQFIEPYRGWKSKRGK